MKGEEEEKWVGREVENKMNGEQEKRGEKKHNKRTRNEGRK